MPVPESTGMCGNGLWSLALSPALHYEVKNAGHDNDHSDDGCPVSHVSEQSWSSYCHEIADHALPLPGKISLPSRRTDVNGDRACCGRFRAAAARTWFPPNCLSTVRM